MNMNGFSKPIFKKISEMKIYDSTILRGITVIKKKIGKFDEKESWLRTIQRSSVNHEYFSNDFLVLRFLCFSM